MNPEQYWGWSTKDRLRESGESGGFVTSLLESFIGNYDEIIAVQKVGTVFEGTVCTIENPDDVRKVQGALHAVCIELSHYIKKEKKTAIVLKPCDARAVIENIKRNHLDSKNVLLIGLNCGGTLPAVRTMEFLEKEFDVKPEDVTKEEITKGNLVFQTVKGEFEKSIDELEEEAYGRRESCRYCDVKIPSMCDIACGNWGTPSGKNITFIEVFTEKGKDALEVACAKGFVVIKEPSEKLAAIRSKVNTSMVKLAGSWNRKILGTLLEMPSEKRFVHIRDMLSTCIGCYACRKVCPVCKCSSDCKCVQSDPDDLLPISQFHAIRLLHLMESCIGCGNCSDVCPVDIPLAHLHQLFARTYEKRNGYKPGMSVDDVPPLSRGDFPEGY
ncbi:MAG: Coenzyme F420 hydrogenase/dehydrogenase, beta subunit C-terminal domain [Candidatus Methanofastidiosia archaeon]